MAADDGTEPVADDEVLFRRIPISTGWYADGQLSPEAFDPRPDETTGISIYRKKYKSLEDVARGKSKRGYYVAEFRAGDLRRHGIEVEPRPLLNDSAHAELPGLTCLNRLDAEALERKRRLARLSLRVHGPFVQE